jgi:type VI protein secretion system component VasK
MAGYLIAVIAFALPLGFGATGIGRPRVVIGLGAVLACIWTFALVADRAQNEQNNQIVPVWFLASLVVLLYLIWCGGLWLGLRLRKARAH